MPKIIPYGGYYIWRVTEILSRDNPFMVVVEGRPEKEERPSPVAPPSIGDYIETADVLLKLSLRLDLDIDDPIYQAVLTPSFDNIRNRARLLQNYDDNRFGPAFAEVLERIRSVV